MQLTLVVLAAGIGRRFGGLKQVKPVGPGGEKIVDYTVFDALRAGFNRVVFVIRPEMQVEFRDSLGDALATRVPVEYAFQTLDALPDGFTVPGGRTKPWGTAHAVLCAREQVSGPFAVVNADDFYGASAYTALAEFLQADDEGDPPTHAMVGYALRHTMSEKGTVSRGVCRCTPDGQLESIVETVGIERVGSDGRYTDEIGQAHMISGDATVSMNFWGFRQAILEQLRAGFSTFLKGHGETLEAEIYLPAVIQDAMKAGQARVDVLPSRDKWCGITHADDVPRVQRMIAELIERGVYPRDLWG